MTTSVARSSMLPSYQGGELGRALPAACGWACARPDGQETSRCIRFALKGPPEIPGLILGSPMNRW